MIKLTLLFLLIGYCSVHGYSDWHNHPFPVYGNITVFEKNHCHEDRNQNLHWLQFENHQRCLNIVSDIDVPHCLYAQLERNNISYMIRDINFILSRDVIKHPIDRRFTCYFYMLFTHSDTLLRDIFDNQRPRFYPFTTVFLLIPKTMIIPKEHIQSALQLGINLYGVYNGIFNKNIPYFNLNYRRIKNLYTNRTLNTSETDTKILSEYFGNVLTHPLFDASITKKRPFRIAAFNCPPYVMIDKNQ